MRFTAVRAALVAGAVTASMIGAGPAAQAAVEPTISSMRHVKDDNGRLEVAASSDTAITSITASVVPAGGGDPVEVTDFDRASGEAADGVWRSGRLTLPEFGTYSMTVTVTDADGDQTTAYPWEFRYGYLPVLASRTITPDRLSVADPVVTVTGVIHRLDPRTGESEPWSGRTVTLRVQGAESYGTTTSTGQFEVSGSPNHAASTGTDVRLDVDTDEPGIGQVVLETTVPNVVSPTRVLFDEAEYRADEGAAVTVSGLVEYQVDGAWTPAPAWVTLDVGDTGAQVSTDGDGRFSYATKARFQSYWLTASLGASGHHGRAFLAESGNQVAVRTDRRKVTLNWSKASITQYSELYINATLTKSNGVGLAKGTKVYLEQWVSSSKSWKNLGWIQVGSGGKITFYALVANPRGTWRLRYYGHDKWYQPALSRSWQVSRYDTRVAGFDASPEPVRKGKYVTVRGTLQRKTSTAWKSFGSQKIYYFFRAKGSSTWSYAGMTRATSSGRFSRKIKATKDGYYSVVWFTTSNKYVNAYSSEDYVDVR